MSVEFLIYPEELAVITTIGPNTLEEFKRVDQQRIESNIKNEEDLLRYIKKAGINIERSGDIFVTGIPGFNTNLFWDKFNGVWYAVWNHKINRDLVQDLLVKIENASKRKLFDLSIDYSAKITKKIHYPTQFKNKGLLIKTLKKYGISCDEENNRLIFIMSDMRLVFESSDSGIYSLLYDKDDDINKIYSFFMLFDEEYKKEVQRINILRLKESIIKNKWKIISKNTHKDSTFEVCIEMGEQN